MTIADCSFPPALSLDVDLLALSRSVPLYRLRWSVAAAHGVEVWVKREDLLDATLQGNKFYKLFYHLQAARRAGATRIISFGGAYSNHIHALAAAGAKFGFETLGVIRGEPAASDNPTLNDARRFGMTLHYVSRAEYRLRDQPAYRNQLLKDLQGDYLIPEGGSGYLGAKGCTAIGEGLSRPDVPAFNYLYTACGTGCTLAGIIAGIAPATQVIGVPVVKGINHLLQQSISEWLAALVDTENTVNASPSNWHLNTHGHCGGYGRFPAYLRQFMDTFEADTSLCTDPVYTAKLLFSLQDDIVRGKIPEGAKIVIIHSGGLQGRRGFTGLSDASHG